MFFCNKPLFTQVAIISSDNAIIMPVVSSNDSLSAMNEVGNTLESIQVQ
jgi:hypothetical protein